VEPLERLFPALEGSHANGLVFLAVAVALVAWWTIHRTRTGYELRAVGANAEAARAAGISLPTTITKALLVSGGLAGLAAAPFVLSNNFYYEQDMLAGTGFMGIAVAVLAGNDPLRVLVSAFLMAALTQAGEVVNGSGPSEVPKEIVIVLMAVVIVSVLVAQGLARRLVQRAEARRARRAE
jgi:simple sugar transport system permease protein